MNKLLFHFERDFNDDITLIANNHKDLEDYLEANCNWYRITIKDDLVSIIENDGFNTEYVNLKWVKHI